MNTSISRPQTGFSLLIVLSILVAFSALFPLIHLQTGDNFQRSRHLVTFEQIRWARDGETQRAHLEAARRTYAAVPDMTAFTHVATYTLPPGDYRQVPFTIQVSTNAIPSPTRSDEWQVTQNLLLLENSGQTEFATPTARNVTLVTPMVTFEFLDDNKIIATFSREMSPGLLNPLSFTISGPGQGTLGVHPTSVTLSADPADPLASHTYLLVWDTGARLVDQPITVTIAYAGDFQGTPIGGITGIALEPPNTLGAGMWKTEQRSTAPSRNR